MSSRLSDVASTACRVPPRYHIKASIGVEYRSTRTCAKGNGPRLKHRSSLLEFDFDCDGANVIGTLYPFGCETMRAVLGW